MKAQKFESYFKDKRIDHVYISDLTRTQETYRYIFPYDIPSTVTSLLRERSLGVFEGEYKDKLMQDAQYHRYFNDPEYKDFRHSFTQKRLRVKVIEMYIIEFINSLNK